MVDNMYRIFLLIFIASGWAINVSGQADSSKVIELKPVYIIESKPSFATSSRNIVALTNSEIKESGAQTLSDALASLPGVSQLTTGAISKPVIRGLSGDRISINISGIRLEDQQWEDEHGLGLSEAGIGRVELIKGPAALLFGSDAMGGVVNVVEEDFQQGVTMQNINFKVFSNTYGIGLDYGLKKSGKNTFILRGGAESHADYSDDSSERVPNTRFALYNLKSAFILQRDHWKSENRLLLSFNQFGFIADTSEIHEADEEPRLSREFEDAHHNVFLVMLTSRNSIQINETTELIGTVGIQSNHRTEQERGEEVDLNLLLNTGTLNFSLQKKLRNNWNWTNGMAAMFQNNKNFGERIIVPDAGITEGSVFSYLKKRFGSGPVDANFEAGLRYDHLNISALQTDSFNLPGSPMPPFNRGYHEFSGSIGQSIILKNLVLKADIGTGFRAGNLAELSANGLHEGTPNWYIGDPDMKLEECLNGDVSASWNLKWLTLHGSVFRNGFKNFIYLRPTNEEYSGYRIFRYEQTDATLQGFEAGVGLEKSNFFNVSIDYSFLDARKKDGTWLPLMPANRILFKSKYFIPTKKTGMENPFLSFGIDKAEAQNNIDLYEAPTPGYWLFHAGAGVTFHSLRFMLTCRNLTNTLYYDHLSRLKYYGIYDMGRNFVLNVGWQF
jgi:iron complex outermembrane recepter protein